MRFALILIALMGAVSARAAALDMSTQTCQDWLDADDDAQDRMVAWLRGYLSGRSGVTLYNEDGRGDAATLKVYCQRHPTIGVVSAAAQWKH
jgi:hypothetical protein